MNAVVLSETGGPEVLAVGSAPDPVPGPGEVLIALRAAALNRRDVFVRKGIAPSPLPVIPARTAPARCARSARASPAWPRATRSSPSPRSAGAAARTRPPPASASSAAPTTGPTRSCCVMPAENVFPKPGRLSWEEAAALPLAGLTAYRALVSRARVRPGETVLVIGIGGGVATTALHLARRPAAGCS